MSNKNTRPSGEKRREAILRQIKKMLDKQSGGSRKQDK